jgi:hypothetical protein
MIRLLKVWLNARSDRQVRGRGEYFFIQPRLLGTKVSHIRTQQQRATSLSHTHSTMHTECKCLAFMKF